MEFDDTETDRDFFESYSCFHASNIFCPDLLAEAQSQAANCSCFSEGKLIGIGIEITSARLTSLGLC
jgi:hypothetical protein